MSKLLYKKLRHLAKHPAFLKAALSTLSPDARAQGKMMTRMKWSLPILFRLARGRCRRRWEPLSLDVRETELANKMFMANVPKIRYAVDMFDWLREYFQQGEVIQTRLNSEREFFPNAQPYLPGLNLNDDELIAFLNKLRKHRAIARTETPTDWDTEEYYVLYRLCGPKR
ncbi:MAG: hypothetical protein L0Y70_03045 [Gemmataceae bacterium]|nr:hypothetical protein [Gemmataceae bacterium]